MNKKQSIPNITTNRNGINNSNNNNNQNNP
jgi:hypothetical protein